jgi:cysteine-rich repeat protein
LTAAWGVVAASCGGSDNPIVVGPGATDSGSDSTSSGSDAAADHATGGPDAPHDATGHDGADATSNGGDSGDTGTAEAGTGDTGTADTGAADTGAADTGAADTGVADTGIADTGVADTGVADTGVADTGTADTGTVDTGPADTGTAETGPADTGAGDAPADSGPPVCGDGVREPPEQCDDGNTTSFDGCSSTCTFEQSTRATKVRMDWTTDGNCGANAVGSAFGLAAHTPVQNMIDSSVQTGAVTVLLTYLALQDLTGASGTTSVGSVTGLPEFGDAGAYNGTADLDWWYLVDPASLNGGQIASKLLPGTFGPTGLSAGPGTVWVSFAAGEQLKMVQTSLSLPIGASNTPIETTALPPGHLPGEHLDPALTSFATGGGTNVTPTGWVCGGITAASLSTSSIPSALLPGGSNACNEGYTTANSMLDVFVGGCTTSIFRITVIASTQPDGHDPDSPAAGAGAPYMLSASSAATKVVDTCRDGSNAMVSLPTCLAAATYSTYLHLAVDRVILR